MKSIRIFALCAMGAVLASCSGNTSDEKRPESITADEVNEISYLTGYSFGQYIKGNDMGALSFAQIEKGIKDAINDVEIDEDSFYEKMNEYMQKRSEAKLEINKAEAEAFFAKNAKEADVITTESGVQYKIVRKGNGVKPGPEDEVEVNYEGKLLDGTVFDSSYERNQPFEVNMAAPRVIEGWTEILKLMPAGSKWEVVIPQDKAYGAQDMGQIKPFSTLIFTIEVLK